MLAIIFGIIVTILVVILFKDFYKDLKEHFIYVICLFITSIFVYAIIANIEFLSNIISQSDYPIYDKFVLALTSISISLLIDGIIASIMQEIYENNVINKYEKMNKNIKYEYYRDILQEKSPTILSYCYNRKINVKDEVVAILLTLQRKGIIEIKGRKLIIGDVGNLKEHEKYILKNFKKTDDKEFKKTFKEMLLRDLEKEGYVYSKNDKGSCFDIIMGFFIVWMIIYTIVAIPIFIQFSSIGVMIFLAYFITFVGIPIFEKIEKEINPAIRTEKALEISGKLKGLKNYIKDYSNIKDNGVENINLFDEYVIYAIILDIKGKLNNESKQIYRNIKNLLV